MRLIHLGTELQEQYQIGTGTLYNEPHGSSIGGYHRTPLRETILRPSADRRSELSITGNESNANLGAFIDRRVRGSQ
jgi:hypothetical protein